ncbi:MAG: lipocalin family protein [Nonlabens sp.]|nr:lipocalin family protein [Nonlabens sp.]
MTSCSDDDESGASPQGNYKLTAESEGGVAISLDSCELQQEISFAATTGSLKVLDDDTPPCTYENIPFSYTVSGSNLTLTISNGLTVTAQAVIEELSSSTLRFRIISDSFSGAYAPEDIIVQSYTRL